MNRKEMELLKTLSFNPKTGTLICRYTEVVFTVKTDIKEIRKHFGKSIASRLMAAPKTKTGFHKLVV